MIQNLLPQKQLNKDFWPEGVDGKLNSSIRYQLLKIAKDFKSNWDLKESGIKNKLCSFVDTQLNYWVNFTCPLLPRGYVTSSFLKLLSFGLWVGYKKIFILGFDNTYPKDLFSNSSNKILEYNHHTNSKNDYVQDQTATFTDFADILCDLTELFIDIRKFKKYKNIINLDPFSINTNFQKKSILNKPLFKISSKQI